MNDPTHGKESERILRELAESLQESQRIAGLGSYVLDLKTMHWSSSDVLDQIFGIGLDYVRSVEGWTALIYLEDREPMAEYFKEQVLGQHRLFNREYRIVRHKDRERRWVHGLGRLEFDHDGVPLKMRGTIQDITDRKRAEADLRQSKELLQLFTQHAPAALAMFDRNMRYIAASRRWCENFGLQLADILGRSHYDVFPDLPPRWLSVHRRALGGETIKSDEERYERNDGSVFFVGFEGRPSPALFKSLKNSMISWASARGALQG